MKDQHLVLVVCDVDIGVGYKFYSSEKMFSLV